MPFTSFFNYDDKFSDTKKLTDALESIDSVRASADRVAAILRAQDENKCNALMLAAKCGQVDSMRQLLAVIQDLPKGAELLHELAAVVDVSSQTALQLAQEGTLAILQAALPVVAVDESPVVESAPIPEEPRLNVISADYISHIKSKVEEMIASLEQSDAEVIVYGEIRDTILGWRHTYYDDFIDDDVGDDSIGSLLSVAMLSGDLSLVKRVVHLLNLLPDQFKFPCIEDQLTKQFGDYGNPLSLAVTWGSPSDSFGNKGKNQYNSLPWAQMVQCVLDLLNQLPESKRADVLLTMLQHRYKPDPHVDSLDPIVFIKMMYEFTDLTIVGSVFEQCVDKFSVEVKRAFILRLLSMLQENNETYYFDENKVIDILNTSIAKLPIEVRKQVLRQRLLPVEGGKPVDISAYEFGIIGGGDMAYCIDVRTVSEWGRWLLSTDAIKDLGDKTGVLLKGLYEWVTPWHVTSTQQQERIVAWFGQSATAEEKQFLLEKVSRSKLYRRCLDAPKAATLVGSGYVLAGRSAGNGAELKPVTRESYTGGGGGGRKSDDDSASHRVSAHSVLITILRNTASTNEQILDAIDSELADIDKLEEPARSDQLAAMLLAVGEGGWNALMHAAGHRDAVKSILAAADRLDEPRRSEVLAGMLLQQWNDEQYCDNALMLATTKQPENVELILTAADRLDEPVRSNTLDHMFRQVAQGDWSELIGRCRGHKLVIMKLLAARITHIDINKVFKSFRGATADSSLIEDEIKPLWQSLFLFMTPARNLSKEQLTLIYSWLCDLPQALAPIELMECAINQQGLIGSEKKLAVIRQWLLQSAQPMARMQLLKRQPAFVAKVLLGESSTPQVAKCRVMSVLKFLLTPEQVESVNTAYDHENKDFAHCVGLVKSMVPAEHAVIQAVMSVYEKIKNCKPGSAVELSFMGKTRPFEAGVAMVSVSMVCDQGGGGRKG